MILIQDSEDYTDYDCFLNTTETEGEKEVHVRVTYDKDANTWYMIVQEECFDRGMNEPCGPMRELTLSAEQATKLIREW